MNKPYRAQAGFNFPLLSDVGAAVIRRYDLLHAHGGPHQEEISRPAEFLVDSAGIVRWRNLTESINVRARPEQVLKTFDEEEARAAPTGQ